ncbi:NlpC/P60 family protein [Sagittula sp. S175]|uniref:C40 family peptidase n=1 Tax=Sagittula sp. S175 TaxID=3415129 RepID=UPI003C7B2668
MSILTDRRTRPATDRVVARWHADSFPGLAAVDPERMYVTQTVTDLCRGPGGARDRQLTYGSAFEVLERRNGWSFGLAPVLNGYVGWIADSALRPEDHRPPAGHWVATRQTHAYPEPDFKTRETTALPHGAQVFAGATEGRFTRTELGWVPTRHLSETAPQDPVAVSELYLGVPYLWGGNSIWGIDCSGLVQIGCVMAGHACPGDSDLQQAHFPTAPTPDHQRGDLLFWKGHVAWVSDPDTLLHANAHSMSVAYEPIRDAIARIEAAGDGPVTKHARPL